MNALSAIVIALGIITATYRGMNVEQARAHVAANPEAEILYLPKGDHLELLSFGFQNVYSHILWFRTINYFGKHFREDQNYPWLGHMCELVTRLNPRANHVYEFCAAMLSWEAKMPEKSVEILSRAIEANPNFWFYYYLRAFNYMYFLHDAEKAQQDFALASSLPDAPPIVSRLARRTLANVDDPQNVIAVLSDMVRRARDENQRLALKKHLDEATEALRLKGAR